VGLGSGAKSISCSRKEKTLSSEGGGGKVLGRGGAKMTKQKQGVEQNQFPELDDILSKKKKSLKEGERTPKKKGRPYIIEDISAEDGEKKGES